MRPQLGVAAAASAAVVVGAAFAEAAAAAEAAWDMYEAYGIAERSGTPPPPFSEPPEPETMFGAVSSLTSELVLPRALRHWLCFHCASPPHARPVMSRESYRGWPGMDAVTSRLLRRRLWVRGS